MRLLTLRLREMNITFNEADSQLVGYFEIVVDRIYDQSVAVIAQPGEVVVDVGANIGVFAIWQARRGARIVAYEPHPRAFANMLVNLDANNVKAQVTCVNAAVSNSAGISWLSTSRGSSAAHLTKARSGEGAEVRTVKLDESLAEQGVGVVDLLKIDVEGAELEVIAGGQATLSQTRAVIIEVHDGLSADVIDELLAPHGLSRDPLGAYPNLYYARR